MLQSVKEIRALAQREGAYKYLKDLLEQELHLQEVLTRIRNRVGNFVLNVEHSSSLQSELAPAKSGVISVSGGKSIFLGHGGSRIWKDLRDFLADRLELPWNEFNRESVAGKSNKERLEHLLDDACFAFLVMTAEDEHIDQTIHARENVIHEIGLFQGRLGFSKAIVLIEEGCTEFSNIHGLTQIRFPRGDILAKSEEIRRVLEREGILDSRPTQ